jgi:hypothetical protein
MRRIFWGFCRNWFLIDPLHYLPSHSAFRFEFRRDICNQKTIPQLGESASRRVVDSRLGELVSCQLGELVSRRLPESGSRYSNLLKFSIDFLTLNG